MSRLVQRSRTFLLGAAFIGVMAGVGGFVGAVAGSILLLLGHAVIGLSASMIALLPASMGFGVLGAISLSVYLLARHIFTFTWQPRLVSTVVEQEQVSS